jgi:hypothetical protein
MLRRRDSPYLDLDPVAALLLQDAAVQIKECVEADVRTVHQLQTISADDNQRLQRLPYPKLMSAVGVRRDKAALSSGCKPHPANAPVHGVDVVQALGAVPVALVNAVDAHEALWAPGLNLSSFSRSERACSC